MSDLHELKYPLSLVWGASLERGFVFKDTEGTPIDLTGYTAEVQIRERLDAEVPTLALSSVQATPAGSGLGIVPSEGKVWMRIAGDESDNLPGKTRPARLVWDIRLTPPGGEFPKTYFRGSDLIVYPASTR